MSEPARARTGTSSDAARRLREATAGTVAGGLEPFVWDQDAAIAYEVAVDTIGLVIAAYSGLIAAEERRQAPDPARLQEWEEAITRATREEQALAVQDRPRRDRRQQIARATADRRALIGADRTEVERVSAAYAAEYRRLRQSTDA